MKHKNFTTRAELLRAAADSIEMQEKAGIGPVCKYSGRISMLRFVAFDGYLNQYEFPLAVVEGRAVWEGDELYVADVKRTISGTSGDALCWESGEHICFGLLNFCSWNPPKPKTVMVELTVEDAEHFSTQYLPVKYAPKHMRNLGDACRKALEEMI